MIFDDKPKNEQLLNDSTTEAIVYFLVSPEQGSVRRIYTDEDLLSLGGVHSLERLLEKQCYWFVPLGRIRAETSVVGLTFKESELDGLPEPLERCWRLGRRHPAFRGSTLERHTFQAAFDAVELTLRGWEVEEDGGIEAYALKELKISGNCLRGVIGALHVLPKVHEVIEITILKYWYDEDLPGPHLPEGFVGPEFTLKLPIQFVWSESKQLVRAQVMPLALC